MKNWLLAGPASGDPYDPYKLVCIDWQLSPTGLLGLQGHTTLSGEQGLPKQPLKKSTTSAVPTQPLARPAQSPFAVSVFAMMLASTYPGPNLPDQNPGLTQDPIWLARTA